MPAAEPSRIEFRRSSERFTTRLGGLESRHSFSFGEHYDPTDVGYAVLVANNDETVQAGAGFDAHPHRDLEIVTWVLGGRLAHRDSTGRSGVVYPGLAQRMSAGTGVVHSERNAEPVGGEAVRFVQMWVLPDEPGLPPGYEHRDVGDELARGGLVTVASGMRGRRDAAVRINNAQAALHAARLAPGESVDVPRAPYLHLYLPRGSLGVDGVGALAEGDAVRLTASDGLKVVAGSKGAEILVWEMHAGRRGH